MDRRLRLSVRGTTRFFAVFALALWMWSFFRSYLLFMLMLLMITGFIISAAALWFAGDRIQVGAALPDNRVGKNTDIVFDIRIENPMRLVGFSVDVAYRWGNIFTGSMEEREEKLWAAPKKGGGHKFLLSSRYAGLIRVSLEEYKVYDLLHIFYFAYRTEEGTETLVWPAFSDREDTEELYECVEGFPKENESRKRGTDYNPDYDIREYIAGDELKNIHWKLSAKQGKMMVRERFASGREKINVLLPLSDNLGENDALMESLYGMCRLLIGKEYPIQLFWQGADNGLCSRFIAELGELEAVLGDIFSANGIRRSCSVGEQMSVEHPSESYILVKTGAYKGAYIV